MEVSASAMQDGDGGVDNKEAMDAADGAVTASHGGMAQVLRHLRSLEADHLFHNFKSAMDELCTNLKKLAVEDNLSLMAKRWMDEVRNLCYDTEDYFDKVQHSGADLGKSAPYNQTSSEFSELMDRAECAGKRYKSFVLPAQPIKSNQEYEEASSSSSFSYSPIVEPSSSVFDDMVKHLAFDNNKQFKVVSILGYAGVGKSTLARRLYRRFGDRFQCRAFVRVSRNPDIRTFLFSVLSQIKEPHTDVPCDVQTIFGNIKAHLQHRRYLIVIDDLWSSPTWDIINRAFPRNNGYSRIITTTHIQNVAKACCSYNSTNIFRMELPYPPELSGLPFETTIMVVKLLRCNFTIEQQGHLQNFLLSSLRTNPTPEGMKELLNRIYGILPHHLKTCLLYFNMYPEDYTIKKNDLVKQWVAEGFVSAVNGQTPDMVAEIYFDELISRGLIEKVDTNYNDQVLSCTVHHVVSDFIRNKSREENFITIADYFQTTPGNSDKVRRLSAQFGGAKGAKIPQSVGMSQLRSLIYFGFCVPTVSQYNLLRVLILHVWADKDKSIDLSSIHELFRLRYLKIVCDVRVKLRAEIGRLQYLETLDLDTRVVGFPSDIAHFQKLLHLRLPREANMPHGIDKMTSLCSLAYFQLSEDNVLDLGKLTNLQDLHLTCSGVQNDRVAVNMESLWSILEKFSKLKSLIIDGDVLPIGKDAGASATSIPVDCLSIVSCPPPHLQKLELSSKSYIFPSLPEWIAQLSKLSILKIAVRNLLRNNVQILNRLTALTVLSLYVCNAPAGGVVFYEEFKNLKYFKFNCTAPCLTFVEGAMVKVERLKLCFNADSIEQYDLTLVGFQYLTSLKEISVKFEDPNSSNSGNAESALVDAVSKHPGEPILNVEPKEETFYGDQEKNVSAQRPNPQIPERQGTVTDRDLGDQRVQEKKRKHTTVEKEETPILMGQNVVEGKVTGKQHEYRQNTSSEDTVIQEDRCQTSHIDRTTLKPPESSFPTQKIVMDPLSIAAVGWAISTAGWIISPLVAKLVNRASSIINIDVSKKMKDLETSILPRLALIVQALEKSPRLKLEKLVRELKSAFYEVEDILDEADYCRFIHKKQLLDQSKKEKKRKSASDDGAGPSKKPYQFISRALSNRKSTTSRDIRIESNFTVPGPLKNRLKELLEKIENLIDGAEKIVGLANLLTENKNSDQIPNVTPKYSQNNNTADPPQLVTGRDVNREELQRMLHATEQDDACYSVIGIHGIPGSGKTTLAQYVCKSEKKASYFDRVMWIHVTQNFSVNTIYREMFEAASYTPGKKESCPKYRSLDVLQTHLEEVLHEKRFLLVLDDIWCNKDNHGQQNLEDLFRPLKVGKRGSKILVTSRSADALSDLGPVRCTPFPIPEMNSKDIYELLMHYALQGITVKAGDRKTMEVIGKQIAEKLKGSPLAATVVGAQLRNQKVNDWINFNNRNQFDDVMNLLRWSYQHFGEEIRRCFAYCSIFPRRYPLKREELIRLWVAQGFITTTNGEEKEDAAERCFNHLVSASFVRPVEHNLLKEFNHFTMHDLIHDLAMEVSGSECLTIENGRTAVIPQDVRHIFIQFNSEEYFSKVLESKELRTLIITLEGRKFNVAVLGNVFRKLPKLRVLILAVEGSLDDSHKDIISVPEYIGNLKHLRYFGFQGRVSGFIFYCSLGMSTEHIELPRTFAQLYHLEVLDIRGMGTLSFLSSEETTSNLINLRHVLIDKNVLDISLIGRPESLQTLEYFVLKHMSTEKGYELCHLKKMNKLRGRLEIEGLENVPSREDAVEAELHRKEYLTEVRLEWGSGCYEPVKSSEVLEALRPPQYLQTLEIYGFQGSRYPNWMMGGGSEVPMCVQHLELWSCSKLGPIPGDSVLFRQLSKLSLIEMWDGMPDIEHLSSLVELEIQGCCITALPSLPQSLKTLTIIGCGEITALPSLPQSLEKLDIKECRRIKSLPTMPRSLKIFEVQTDNSEFATSCKTEGSENWEKIRHIPWKTIEYKNLEGSDDDDDSESEDDEEDKVEASEANEGNVQQGGVQDLS